MFRSQPYLENTTYVQINLDTRLTFPGNNQYQTKTGYKFTVRDRDNFYDWYNTYLHVDFKFEAKANGANIGDTESAPINGSFSLIKSLKLSSAGKNCTRGDNIHKGIFIKNLLVFSDNFSRSVAKNQFWYLDSDDATATDNNATNLGMRARALLSHEGEIVKTIIPLNRYSFFESLSDRLLPPLQLEFEIELQNDQEMIFQNDGTARRIVVRKFELWIPQLHFTGKGQTLANENFFKTNPMEILTVRLTDSQKKKLQKAYVSKTAVTLRVKPGQIERSDELLLTATQISRLKKTSAAGKGMEIKLSQTQIQNTAQHGGSLFSAMLGLARPLIKPALGALASAGLSFSTEKVLKKIFAKGLGRRKLSFINLSSK